ncbi:MAG: hypothetical protein R3A51_02290 [Nannocystaceae bacterium]
MPFGEESWIELADATFEACDAEPDDFEDMSVVRLRTPDRARIDTSSFERWVQSCLQQTVQPGLRVTGALGPWSREALCLLQRSLRLSAHGLLDDATLAALEQLSGIERPVIAESRRRAGAGELGHADGDDAAPELVVTTRDTDEGVVHKVALAGDAIEFRYRTRERLHPDGSQTADSFNVWSYRKLARKDSVGDAELQAGGLSMSEIRILRENAFKESRGSFGAVNSWDRQIISWGMAQFAGHAGTLANLLAFIAEDAPVAFAAWFTRFGVSVEHGSYPYIDRKKHEYTTRRGAHVVIVDGETRLAGDRAWEHVRQSPRLIGLLMLAGNDLRIQVAQCRYWKFAFLDKTVARLVCCGQRYTVDRRQDGVLTRVFGPSRTRDEWKAWAARPESAVDGENLETIFTAVPDYYLERPAADGSVYLLQSGQRLGAFLTSEYAFGLMGRLCNWMPAYVRPWTEDFFAALAEEHPELAVHDPATWEQHPALEEEFLAKVRARRAAAKQGSYDPPYGDTLDHARGSFTAGSGELDAAVEAAEEASRVGGAGGADDDVGTRGLPDEVEAPSEDDAEAPTEDDAEAPTEDAPDGGEAEVHVDAAEGEEAPRVARFTWTPPTER